MAMMINLVSLSVPFLYLGFLVGSLMLFSTRYRKRKAEKAAALDSWFGPDPAKEVYEALLSQGTDDDPTSQPPEMMIKMALMGRTVENVRRLMKLRASDAPLMSMIQAGNMGEELLDRYRAAARSIENELKEILEEANSFQAGWGESIFRTANEIISSRAIDDQVRDFQTTVPADVEFWSQQSGSGAGVATSASKAEDLSTSSLSVAPLGDVQSVNTLSGQAVEQPSTSVSEAKPVISESVPAVGSPSTGTSTPSQSKKRNKKKR